MKLVTSTHADSFGRVGALVDTDTENALGVPLHTVKFLDGNDTAKLFAHEFTRKVR